MGFSNSSLVSYANLCSDYTTVSDRKIERIIIHHAAAVWSTAKVGVDYFKNSERQVSSNYCIGNDGSVGLSVEEKNRAWTTGSLAADRNAITIEVSDSDTNWNISNAAMTSLINLCTDVCKRNGISKLTKGTNLYGHRDFAATLCPGNYLYGKLEYIATEVNKRLSSTTTTTTTTTTSATTTTTTKHYRCQVGAYKVKSNATNIQKQLKTKGITSIVKSENGIYYVQCGYYSKKSNAEYMKDKLIKLGFQCIIKEV